MRKILIAAVVSSMLAMATPASAATVVIATDHANNVFGIGGGAGNPVAKLPLFPLAAGDTDTVSSLSGHVHSVEAGLPSLSVGIGDTAITYAENTCATGTAGGSLDIGGTNLDFEYNRVGFVAALIGDGSAVLEFSPNVDAATFASVCEGLIPPLVDLEVEFYAVGTFES